MYKIQTKNFILHNYQKATAYNIISTKTNLHINAADMLLRNVS